MPKKKLEETSTCVACGLCKKVNHVNLGGRGNKDAEIILVGEAPGPDEDEKGSVFAGPAGRFLSKQILRQSGLDEDEIFITNAVRCYPGKDRLGKIRNPSIAQIRSCRNNLLEELKSFKNRKVVILLGNVPLHAVLPIYKSKSSDDQKKSAGATGIMQWRGKQIWSPWLNCWVVPTLHPSYVMRQMQQGIEYPLDTVLADFELAIKLAGRALPIFETPKQHFVRNVDKATKVLELLLTKRIVGYDIETTGLDVEKDSVRGLAFADTEVRGIYVYWDAIKKSKKNLSLLGRLLQDSNIEKITHNGAFDDRFMRAKGLPSLVNWHDTMLAASLLDENFPKGLKPNAFRYTPYGGYDYELEEYKRLHKVHSYADIPDDIMEKYAAYDVICTLILWRLFKERLEKEGLMLLYDKILRPVRSVMNDAEETGFKVDVPRAEFLDKKCDEAIKKIEKTIYDHAGGEFNLRSPKQLAEVLYGKLKLKAPENAKTKSGGLSCGSKVLPSLAKQKNGDIAQALLDVKYIASQQSKFIKLILENVRSDGRIHTTYNLTGTVTGRTSCQNPGIHNIPRDRFIRTLFISSEDRALVEADVKSAELRILAVYCGEPFLIKAFNEGRDLHSETYKLMFNKSADYVPTDDERFIAKSINFGLVYGRGPKSLAEVLGVSLERAKELIEIYFKAMPRVRAFLDKNIKETRKRGYAVSIFGRKRHLPDILSDDFMLSSKAQRQANNSIIQSAAADYTYIILGRVSRAIKRSGLKARIVHTVHDCVIVDTPLNEVEKVKSIIIAAFTKPVKMVPIKMEMDVGVVSKWGEHKDSRLEDVLAKYGLVKKTVLIKKTQDDDDIVDDEDMEDDAEESAGSFLSKSPRVKVSA